MPHYIFEIKKKRSKPRLSVKRIKIYIIKLVITLSPAYTSCSVQSYLEEGMLNATWVMM